MFTQVAHHVKNCAQTRQAVASVNAAAKLVGRKAGFIEGYEHAQAGKPLEKFALYKQDLDAVLAKKAAEFNELKYELVDFVVSHRDRPCCFELKESFDKAGLVHTRH